MPSLSVSILLFPNNLNGLQAGLADNATSLAKLLSPNICDVKYNPVIMKCSIFLLKISQQRRFATEKACVSTNSKINTQF